MLYGLLFLLRTDDVRVSDLGSLRAAVVHATAGTRILIAPGDYPGGVYATNVNGTADAPIVITGADPDHLPVFHGAWQFQACNYLQVRDIAIAGVSGNAIGVDDGGAREKPSTRITLHGLRIMDANGPGTNGIKLAGVDRFTVEGCTVDRFGGCGVDMVGCHDGTITGCRFEHGGGVGVQAKGASSSVSIERCAFRDGGSRGVNLGGSTGNAFYRPPIETIPAGSRYEAKSVTVQGCTFEGSDAPIAFAGADGCTVRFNTFVNPAKWAIRILQETATPDFAPCRNGRFENNVIVFRSDHWFEGGVNVGPNTAAGTFRFAQNWWYCSDVPERSKPNLPSAESGGTIGRDPGVQANLTLGPDSPVRNAGAEGLRS